MAKKRGIRIRISNQRVEALVEICHNMMDEFRPVNDHQRLLREHLAELHEKLQAMLQRNQELYTLMLMGAEATAFYQLWNLPDISRDRYEGLIVDNLLKKMSSIAA